MLRTRAPNVVVGIRTSAEKTPAWRHSLANVVVGLRTSAEKTRQHTSTKAATSTARGRRCLPACPRDRFGEGTLRRTQRVLTRAVVADAPVVADGLATKSARKHGHNVVV